MKRLNWIYVLLILLSLAAPVGYRHLNNTRQDVQPPVIEMEGQLNVSVKEFRTAMLEGVSAWDDRDGDVTASLLVESVRMEENESAAKIVYAAFDRAGNVAKAQRAVVFTDYEKPVFWLRSPMVYESAQGFHILDAIGATDILDGDVSNEIRACSLSGESIALPGIHQVSFRVTNSLGDSNELVLPVEVYPKGAYNAVLKLTDYLVYLKQGASFDARNYLYTYTREEDTVSLQGDFTGELTLEVSGSVDTNVPGVHSVSYTVTQEYEQQTYTAYSKLIVVVEG